MKLPFSSKKKALKGVNIDVETWLGLRVESLRLVFSRASLTAEIQSKTMVRVADDLFNWLINKPKDNKREVRIK